MNLVQIDVIDVKTAKAVVDGSHDPSSAVASTVRVKVVSDRVMKLRAEHDFITPLFDGRADDRLVLPVAVHVGRVNQVDPRIER